MKLIKRNVSKASIGKKMRACLLLSTAITGASVLTWTLTSCYNTETKTILSELIDTGDGSKFFTDAQDNSLTTIAGESLKTRNGYNAYIKRQIGKVLQLWFKDNVAQNYRDAYTGFQTDTDKSWEDKVTSAKNSYRTYYEINLRTDVLDSSGMKDINAWKDSQLNDKVINKFTGDIFGTDYLGMVDAQAPTKKLSPTTIQPRYIANEANWNNLKFVADNSDIDSNNGYNQQVADVYAAFQADVFDSWVRENLPLLTSSVLYKNSQPSGGLKEIFNENMGVDLSKPSYQFEAFPDASENEGDRDTMKYTANGLYQQFINNVEHYYDTANWMVNFPADWTEDSASGILVETNSMYDSLFLPYAAGTGYMLLNAVGGITSQQKIRDVAFGNLSKSNILTNFIYKSQGSPAWWGFSNPSFFSGDQAKDIPSIFSSELLANNNPDYHYSFYKTLASPDGTISDMFTSTTAGGLPLMFMRDGDKEGAGIHIITIDGLKYFTSGNKLDIGKLEEFLKFRSFQKTCGYTKPEEWGNNVTFNINENVKKYFSANDNKKFDLVINFLKSQLDAYKKDPKTAPFFAAVKSENVQELVDLMTNLFGSESTPSVFMQLAQAWQAYGFEDALLKERQKIRSAIVTTAKTFIDNIKNSKPNANGIAGKLPFQVDGTGNVAALEQFYAPVQNGGSVTDPKQIWWLNGATPTSIPQSAMTPRVDQKIMIGAKQTSISELVDQLVTSLNLTKATNVEYAKYTQNIYTDNDAINDAINTLLTASDTGNFVANSYKNTIISEVFKNLNYITLNQTGEAGIGFKPNGGVDQALNNAVINMYYLNNVFKNKLGDYSILNSGVLDNFSNLKDYLKHLWNNENVPVSDFAIKYLLFLNTLDYLLTPITGDTSNAINLTTYLKQNVSFGTAAYVTWVASTPMNAGGNANLQTLFTTPNSTNVDYDFGTGANFNYLNAADQPLPNPNRYLLDNVYQSATIDESGTVYHGFSGLATSSSNSLLPGTVSATIFENKINPSSSQSISLYAYGSEKDLGDHINKLSTIIAVQQFAQELANYGVDTSNVLNSAPETTLGDLKTTLVNDVKNSQTVSYARTDGYFTSSGFHAGIPSGSLQPIQDTSKTKLGYYAFVKPVNYLDVQNINTSWFSNAGNRLNLTNEAFLQIVIDYAMNNSLAQQAALSRLTGNRNQVYDMRLMKLLSSQWVFTKTRSDV